MPIKENLVSSEQLQVYLVPCSGRKIKGIPRGHLYKILRADYSSMGFMPLPEAQTKFAGAIVNDNADALCPSCKADIKKG